MLLQVTEAEIVRDFWLPSVVKHPVEASIEPIGAQATYHALPFWLQGVTLSYKVNVSHQEAVE